MKILIAKKQFSLDLLPIIVKEFWELINSHNIFLFNGNLGAGKTTFINVLCKYLNVQDNVSSPTFSIINEYNFCNNRNIETTIFHIDLYRLNSVSEVIDVGIEDCILHAKAACNYVFIEWAEKAVQLIPLPYIDININPISETERELEIWEVNEK